MTEFRFVQDLSGQTCDAVTKALELQDRRSHIARVSHRRRKALNQILGSGKLAPAQLIRRPAQSKTSLGRTRRKTVPSKSDSANALFFYSPSPASIVQHGNSDPFNGAAIPINSRVNELLAFARDVGTRAIVSNPFFQDTPGIENIVSMFWNLYIGSLHDERLALAWVSKIQNEIAAVKQAKGFNADTVAQLAARDLATRKIRDTLQHIKHPISGDQILVEAIIMLFRAECSAMNVQAAMMHADILKHIMVAQHMDSQLNVFFWGVTLVEDIDLACKRMKRTFFDLSMFASAFQARWLAFTATLKNLPELSFGLNHTVSVEPLKSRFIRARFIIGFRSTLNSDEHHSTAMDWLPTFLTLTIQSHLDVGFLLHYYLDLTAELELRPVEEAAFVTSVSYIQASLVLAAIYVVRRIMQQAIMSGVDVRDASSSILGHLGYNLMQAFGQRSPAELASYQNACLWSLTIGCLGTRALLCDCSSASGFQTMHTWFHEKLLMVANEAGITTWSQLREELQQFIWVDELKSNLSNGWPFE